MKLLLPEPSFRFTHFLQFHQFSGAVPETGGNAEPNFTDNADSLALPRKEVGSEISDEEHKQDCAIWPQMGGGQVQLTQFLAWGRGDVDSIRVERMDDKTQIYARTHQKIYGYDIASGETMHNPLAGSSTGSLRDEYLSEHLFTTLAEARSSVKD